MDIQSTWTWSFNTAFNKGSTVHVSLLRRSNPENEPFTLDILLLLRIRRIVRLGGVFRGRVCKSSRLLHTTLVALLSKDMYYVATVVTLSQMQPTLLCTHCCSSTSPTSLLHIHLFFVVGLFETSVCHGDFFFFCPSSFICKYSLQQVIGLLKYHKYFSVAKTCLRYPIVAQSQGDIAIQRQVQFELLAAAHLPNLRY